MRQHVQSKYRNRMYVMMTSVCLALVSIVVWYLYFDMEKLLMDREKHASQQTLEQIGMNIEYMLGALNTTTYSIYNDNDSKQLMYAGPEVPLQDTIRSLNRIMGKYVSAGPSVHSIYLYNKDRGTYFSTYKGMYHLDEDFVKRLAGGNFLLSDFPMVRPLDGSMVCTQVITDTFVYSGNEPTNAVFVNYSFSWILDNINLLRNEENESALFVVDRDGTFINAVDSANHTDFIAALLENHEKLAQNASALLHIRGKAYLVDTLQTKPNHWELYKILPMDMLTRGITAVRSTLLLINIVAVAAVLLLYSAVTRRLYHPVRHMIAMLPVNGQTQSKDEFSLVESFYLQQFNEIKQLRNVSATNARLLEEPIINYLLTGSYLLSAESLQELYSIYRFHIDFQKPYRICVCAFDDSRDIRTQFDTDKGKMIVLLTLKDIVRECIGTFLPFDYAYSRDECVTLLMQTDEACDQAMLLSLCHQLQEQIKQKLNATVSLALSVVASDYKQVSTCYASALETLAMRMIRGKESVLFADDPTLDAQSYSAYDSSAEERFFDMIAANNFHSALRQVEPIMQAMKKLDPQSVAFALAQISHRLKHIAFTLNAARQEPIDVDQMLATLGGGHMRFLESLPQALCDIVRMLEPSKDEPSLQEIGVVDQALQLIAQRFDDPDLCATYLAQAVGLSAIQLGRLFKRCTGKTIPEAINETRLSKAVRWLRGSDLTTADIALKAGYQNESYFFRVFKEKYGITPRQYEKQYRSATTPSGEA